MKRQAQDSRIGLDHQQKERTVWPSYECSRGGGVQQEDKLCQIDRERERERERERDRDRDRDRERQRDANGYRDRERHTDRNRERHN